MNTKFWLIVLALLIPAVSWASPFLVCDPYTGDTQPQYFMVAIDNAPAVRSDAQAVTGGVRLYYDVASLDFKARHDFVARACYVNSIGVEVCSDPANFTYPAPVIPGAPSGVRLEK